MAKNDGIEKSWIDISLTVFTPDAVVEDVVLPSSVQVYHGVVLTWLKEK